MSTNIAHNYSYSYHLPNSSFPQVLLFVEYTNILLYPTIHLVNAYYKKLKVSIVSIGVIVAVGTALLLLYTQYDFTLTSRPSQESRPIKIACSEPWVGYVPIVLAVDKFFKENNVKWN